MLEEGVDGGRAPRANCVSSFGGQIGHANLADGDDDLHRSGFGSVAPDRPRPSDLAVRVAFDGLDENCAAGSTPPPRGPAFMRTGLRPVHVLRSRNTIRPRVRSYGESSILSRSPGTILIRKRRIFPDT